MLCPQCNVQMFQRNKLGGGQSTTSFYETYEIKECPSCGRKVLEQYSVRVLSDEELKEYEKEKSA